ncbi:NAD(P)(+) transhydrogenase (Re/Si-specific) subunit beta [Burkholderia cepacia]|nr:NAD(P)(+) transhydrogenase (Re/Si-specific) subunit beta [Burkholderia cepacia]
MRGHAGQAHASISRDRAQSNMDKTMMVFGDAKKVIEDMVTEVD